jgi:hypothetical protein
MENTDGLTIKSQEKYSFPGNITLQTTTNKEIIKIGANGLFTINGKKLEGIPDRLIEIVRVILGSFSHLGLDFNMPCKYIKMNSFEIDNNIKLTDSFSFNIEESCIVIVSDDLCKVFGNEIDINTESGRKELFFGLLSWCVMSGGMNLPSLYGDSASV